MSIKFPQFEDLVAELTVPGSASTVACMSRKFSDHHLEVAIGANLFSIGANRRVAFHLLYLQFGSTLITLDLLVDLIKVILLVVYVDHLVAFLAFLDISATVAFVDRQFRDPNHLLTALSKLTSSGTVPVLRPYQTEL